MVGRSPRRRGVPQHAVADSDTEPGRDDGGEPVGQQRGEGVDIHSGDYRGWRLRGRGQAPRPVPKNNGVSGVNSISFLAASVILPDRDG